MADIGEIITIWLKNNCWTHKMLAEKLHVSESTVQKWTVGKRHPDAEMLRRLSDLMLIDIHHFFEADYLPVVFERLDDFVPPCMYGEGFLEILKMLGEEIPEDLIYLLPPYTDNLSQDLDLVCVSLEHLQEKMLKYAEKQTKLFAMKLKLQALTRMYGNTLQC